MPSSTPRRVDLAEGLPVRLRSFLVSGRGAILNLSASGAYVATSMTLLPGAQVRLSIALHDENTWVEADAVVVWENPIEEAPGPNLPRGYGMRFVELRDETRRFVEELMATGALSAPKHIEEALASAAAQSSEHAEPDVPPFRLAADNVRARVPAGARGIYLLSYDRSQEARVGRADADLRAAITRYEGTYAYFHFEIVEEDAARYLRECELFHRLGGDRGQLDHHDHPIRPSGVETRCVGCSPVER